VRDNGIGIPETELVSIFEPFRRLHSASQYEGTGLGLATCKKIVERHGGTIWCASREGQGTSIFFTLPQEQGAASGTGVVFAVPKTVRRRAASAKPGIRAG
jgi:signal transduction histidine kinase